MRKWTSVFLSVVFLFSATFSMAEENIPSLNQQKLEDGNILLAQKKIKRKERSRKTLKKANSSKSSSKKTKRRSALSGRKASLIEALRLAKAGKYRDASIKLFQLSHSPKFRSKKMQIKYILGLMLYQMGLSQVSAFQFISVIKREDSKYLRQSLEKLSLAADQLGDDTLLNYAISRVKVDQFPRVQRDMLFFRIGEYQMRNKQYKAAAKSFSRVGRTSNLFPKAKYFEGLAAAEVNRTKSALASFEDLVDSREAFGITDHSRVAGLMGIARTYYQAKSWDKAIEYYRQIPRDTNLWHETLFESSWAMLRSGRFRSALSNFHSLHSDYYEDFYLPESLLLRSIVYLYICRYDEMEKVLNLYQKIYKPVYKDVRDFLKTVRDPAVYFNEVVKAIKAYKDNPNDIDRTKFRIPFLIVRQIIKEGDFQRSYNYIKKLLKERRKVRKMDAQWKSSAIGKYARKVIRTRLIKARKKAGRQVKAHMEYLKSDLFDLFEQEGFIRYEMINGRKESLKKKIAGKDLPEGDVDDKRTRDYYVQNGFEYWPFRGEYWLDELGNYHYVGTQACE